MGIIEQGLVQQGQIVLRKPLTLPEGTEVVVTVEPFRPPAAMENGKPFAALPFFGMWADRDDLADSAAWLSKERERWHQRPVRPD